MNTREISKSLAQNGPIRIALVGEAMIELQEIPGKGVQQTFGGDTLNTAIYMARMGRNLSLSVDYVTAIGTDRFSQAMAEFWENERVGSSLVQRVSGKQPGLYYIQLDSKGERSFYYWRGESAARKCFEYKDSTRVLSRLETYNAVYLSGISLAILEPVSSERFLTKLDELHSKGVKIYFDFNHRPHLWPSKEKAVACYARIASLAHTVFLSRDEGGTLLNCGTVHDMHAHLRDVGVAETVIRDGKSPCSISRGEETFEVAAKESVRVVDTTAAGDSFSAAYLMARMFGCGVVEAAVLGHSLAARVISCKGAVVPKSAMPFKGTLFA